MIRRRKIQTKHVIYTLLVLVVFLLVFAVAAPDPGMTWNLFAAALLAAIALLLVCILVGSVQLESAHRQLESAHREADVARAEAKAGRAENAKLHRQIALLTAVHEVDVERLQLEMQLKHLFEQAPPRSA